MKKALITALVASTVTITAAQAQTVMRCSHQLPPSHHISVVVDQWAAEVERQSEGAIDVQVFGADSLVKANDNISAVIDGQIECAFSVNFQWGTTLPIMSAPGGPYTMPSIEAWKMWPSSAAASYLEDKLLEVGVRNVVWMFQTNSAVFTSRGRFLQTPADFAGIKMRGLGPAFDPGLEAMGATTVAMPGPDSHEALATGVIDAAVTDVAAAWSRHYYDVQDHFVVVPALAAYLHGYVTPSFYDGLDDVQKEALRAAGEKAAGWALEASIAAAASAPDQLRSVGAHVHVATEAENAAFKAVMQPAFVDWFEAETGAEGIEFLNLIAKIQ